MSKASEAWSVKKFSKFLFDLLKSDRQGLLGVSGETGSGKSTWLAQVFHEFGLINGVGWSFDNMTWSRDEMMNWIDGDKDSPVNAATGLKENQLPEYSGIMADELLPMFYTGNRFEEDQQKAIATFNMCRDRHLLMGGAIPTFWNLDSGLRQRLMLYIFIPRRGVAWVFEKENNPFAKDPWNTQLNEKILRNSPNMPWKSPNYLCTIHFGDWEGNLRSEYYKIRNEKRLSSLASMTKTKESKEKIHKKSVIAIGNLMNYLINNEDWTVKRIAKIADVSEMSLGRWNSLAVDYFQKYKEKV